MSTKWYPFDNFEHYSNYLMITFVQVSGPHDSKFFSGTKSFLCMWDPHGLTTHQIMIF
jgi:hypothetical protein